MKTDSKLEKVLASDYFAVTGELGRLDELTELFPPRDWSTGRHGGPRGMVVVEVLMDEDPEGDA